MVRVVLFDIDGTLVHTGRAGVKAFARVFSTEFGAHDGTERMRFAGRTDVSLVREFFQIHQIEPSRANFDRFFDRYVFWLDHLIQDSAGAPCRGALDFLDDLQTLPNPPLLGLLTGNIRLGAEIKLRHFDLWQTFVTGGFADDHEHRNGIAEAAFRRAQRLLGGTLAPDEVLVVGDTPRDIECGRSIGARVLAVATGGATLDELNRHQPDWAVPDLTAVKAGAVCNGHPKPHR
jgi:phosphoglycolate phosphatase-like HAD superfamily hydrolase